MIIKSFAADSVASALKKVCQEMGRDAIVLRTRQAPAGSSRERIEITACIDKPTVNRVEAVIDSSPVSKQSFTEGVGVNLSSRIKEVDRNLDRSLQPELQLNSDQDRFGGFQEVYGCLQEADLPDKLIERLMASVIEEYDQCDDIKIFARGKLVEYFSSLMLPGLSFKPGDRLLFLGPAGAGKSSVMGKLAARLVKQDRQKVNLTSIDYSKIAAHDELASYAEILRVKVSDPLADPAGGSSESNCITLIDGPALPNDPEKLAKLKEKIKQVNPDYRLVVFSALTRSSDVEELATRILPLEPTHVVVTMFDQTRRCGSVVAAVETLGVKIAFITDSSGGVGQIKAPNPDTFAHYAMGGLKTGVSLE
jgi:flagellar biosynthesis protein FlhF